MIELVLRLHGGERQLHRFKEIREYTAWLLANPGKVANEDVRGYDIRELVECVTHGWGLDAQSHSSSQWGFKCPYCPAKITVSTADLDTAYMSRPNR